MELAAPTKPITRSPIVVVMGHIDHGKTSILDYYRKTRVVEKEAGGITQHINAYEAEYAGRNITFIDTPGHEAFTKMRSRGARVADVAILVVAADEGVKPQTSEAIGIIQQAEIPFVVAINKVDKPEANPERVKQELAQANVLVESYGGKVPSVEVSAKAGQGMDALLEVILLLAELENLQSDPSQPAEGVVIEARRDSRRGITAALLIQEGTLKRGEAVVIGRSVETIKIFENFQGKTVDQAGPSAAVMLAGLSTAPTVGDPFRAFVDRATAEDYAAAVAIPDRTEVPSAPPGQEAERTTFHLILKTDVAGSREVLEETIQKLGSEAIRIQILKSDVGDINESDAKLALTTSLVAIVGFKVKVDPSVRELLRQHAIHVLTEDVIYELVDNVRHVIEEMLPPITEKILIGRATILKTFKIDGKRQIVGGRCEEGVIKPDTQIEVWRGKVQRGTGGIRQLQRDRQDVPEVGQGAEFGILVESETVIQPGDTLQIFEEQITKRTL